MTSIFDNGFNTPRYQTAQASAAQIAAGTVSAPTWITTTKVGSEKFWIWNSTDAVITIVVRAPYTSPYQPQQDVYSQPPSPPVQRNWVEFVKIPPGTSFNLENTSAPRCQVPAGTDIGVAHVPTDGTAPSTGITYFWIWG